MSSPVTRHLVGVVGELWPEARDVRPARGPAPPGARRLVLVPGADRPRLAVPATHPRAAASAMWRFSQALPLRDRVERIVAAVVLRLGGLHAFRDGLVWEADGEPSLEYALGQLLGHPVVLGLGVGPVRAHQKPLLAVFDPSGRAVAFAKVGSTTESRGLVSGEASALDLVGAREYRRLRVPRRLGVLEWGDLRLLVISALPSSPWPPRGGMGRLPSAAVAEFEQVFAAGTAPLATTPWWTRMEAVPDGLVDSGHRRRFGAALESLASRFGASTVELSAWHGDWTPWNMSRHRGVVQLWDWERFEQGVPCGFDRLHWAVNVAARRASYRPDVVDAALRGAEADGTDPLLSAAYLVAITARYLTGGQLEGGGPVRDNAEVGLDLLEERVAELTGGTRA